MVVVAEEATVVGFGGIDAVRRYRVCCKVLAAVENIRASRVDFSYWHSSKAYSIR